MNVKEPETKQQTPYEKRVATMIAKYGSMEAYHQQLKDWASTGGKLSTGGFRAMTAEQRSAAGRKGGSVPRVKTRRRKS